MAELNVGEQCSLESCCQLDFLPCKCSYCNLTFCKEHHFPDRHSCQDFDKTSSSVVKGSTTSKSYECRYADCSAKELVPILCDHCQMQVCLTHRHQSDHKCSNLILKEEDPMSKTREHIASLAKPTKTFKSQKTSVKIQLMKLKMNASGDTSIPYEDRVYFKVLRRDSKSFNSYVSKHWSWGKVLDTLSDAANMVNKNNTGIDKKLKVFRVCNGGGIVTDRMSETLDNLINDESIYNGETVILEYSDQNSIDPSPYLKE